MLSLLGVLVVLAMVTGQQVPPCDPMYKYVERRGHMAGLVTLQDPGGDLTIRITICAKLWRLPDWEIKDGLELEEVRTDNAKLLNYFVVFPVRNPLPKITQIQFNGLTICRTEVPPAANFFSSYTLAIKGRTLVGPATTNPPQVTTPRLTPTQAAVTPTRTYPMKGRPRPRTTTTTTTTTKIPPVRGPPLSSDSDIVDLRPWWHVPDVSSLMPNRPRPTVRATSTTSTPPPATNKPASTRPPAMYKPASTRPPATTKPPARGSKDEEECGLSVRPQSLMLGGREVERGDWPWIATIYVESTREFRCGGVLIGKRFVIVAAHCVADRKTEENKLIVIMGQYDLSKWAERDLQPREVRRIFLHPDFQASPLRNDIALLYLEDEVYYTMYVRPICLGEGDTNMASYDQQMATVIGWNPDENLPRLARVPIVSQESCSEVTGRTTEHTFCAGNLTVSASGNCIGDAEGGLLLPQIGENGNLRWYLRGIASTRLQGDSATCERGGYVVYTDVGQYLPWIRQVVMTTRPYRE